MTVVFFCYCLFFTFKRRKFGKRKWKTTDIWSFLPCPGNFTWQTLTLQELSSSHWSFSYIFDYFHCVTCRWGLTASGGSVMSRRILSIKARIWQPAGSSTIKVTLSRECWLRSHRPHVNSRDTMWGDNYVTGVTVMQFDSVVKHGFSSTASDDFWVWLDDVRSHLPTGRIFDRSTCELSATRRMLTSVPSAQKSGDRFSAQRVRLTLLIWIILHLKVICFFSIRPYVTAS